MHWEGHELMHWESEQVVDGRDEETPVHTACAHELALPLQQDDGHVPELHSAWLLLQVDIPSDHAKAQGAEPALERTHIPT